MQNSKCLNEYYRLIDSSIEELGMINDEDVLLEVHNDGRVVWEPPMKFVVHCDVCILFIIATIFIFVRVNRCIGKLPHLTRTRTHCRKSIETNTVH